MDVNQLINAEPADDGNRQRLVAIFRRLQAFLTALYQDLPRRIHHRQTVRRAQKLRLFLAKQRLDEAYSEEGIMSRLSYPLF